MARLFEVIENPETGWTTRRLEHAAAMLGEEAEWHVELIRPADGATVHFHHADLHIAWLRAVERAHASNIGLDQDDGERAQSAS